WISEAGAWTDQGSLQLPRGADSIRTARFDPRSGSVLLGSWEGSVGRWVPGTPASSIRWSHTVGAVIDLDLSPDGRTWIVLDEEAGAILLSAETGARYANLGIEAVGVARFRDDGALFVAAEDGFHTFSLSRRPESHV